MRQVIADVQSADLAQIERGRQLLADLAAEKAARKGQQPRTIVHVDMLDIERVNGYT